MIIKINSELTTYLLKGIEVKANSSIEEKIQIIVAAKRVNVIDGYAENLDINKFDLAIDWGFMYFITKAFIFCIGLLL